MRLRLPAAALSAAAAALLAPSLVSAGPTGPSDSASAAQDDGPAAAKLKFRKGVGVNRESVTGFLFSENPDCVADRKVLFYRQRVSDSGTVLQEQRIGYSIAELADYEGAKKSKVIKFKLSRSGPVFAKVLPTGDCQEKRSNVVNYARPLR